MKNPPYTVHVDPDFYTDVQEASAWIKKSNLDAGYDEEFADSKVDELVSEISDLVDNLATTPDIGQINQISRVRGFPVYKGRYSVRWAVDDANQKVNVLGLKDSKHPNQLRSVKSDF